MTAQDSISASGTEQAQSHPERAYRALGAVQQDGSGNAAPLLDTTGIKWDSVPIRVKSPKHGGRVTLDDLTLDGLREFAQARIGELIAEPVPQSLVRAKIQAVGLRDYIRSNHPSERSLLRDLDACGSELVARYVFGSKNAWYCRVTSCGRPKLCQQCAKSRAARLRQRYLPVFESLGDTVDYFFLTLTVRNHEDPGTMHNSLRIPYRMLRDVIRKSMQRKDTSGSLFASIKGGLVCEEVQRGQDGKWHNHLHIIVVCTKGRTSAHELEHEITRLWEGYVGYYPQVKVKKVYARNQDGETSTEALTDALLELFKYCVKLHELSPRDTWDVNRILHKVRLFESFGFLRGQKGITRQSKTFSVYGHHQIEFCRERDDYVFIVEDPEERFPDFNAFIQQQADALSCGD